MIGSLRGRLLDRGASEILVEVGGVGYRVMVSPATAVAAGDIGDDVFVHIHHHVREDTQTLYGFISRDERACFEALIGAHGVGPSLALAILAVHRPDALRRALVDDDVNALCLVPGVGKKTATRLLIELKSRLAVDGADGSIPVGAGNGAGASTSTADAREALLGLGYTPDEIRNVLADLPADGDPAIIVKQALQRLALVRRS